MSDHSPDLEPQLAEPAWAQSLPQAALTAMVLVGSWDPSQPVEADATVIQLLGTDRTSVIALCEAGQQAGTIRFVRQRWVPVGESGQSWSWVNHREAFRQMAPLLTAQDWDRFATACHAALAGPGSPTLRRGLCVSLALLGNSDGYIQATPPPSRRAAGIVEQVLAGSLRQWENLREHLGLLAEASPEAFLLCIEQALAQEPDRQAEPEPPSPAMMLSISGALALLALDVDLLPKVTQVLAKLFESENVSKANRKHSQPLKVLDEVFHPQFPKTNATSEERLAALAPLVQQAPQAAWALLLTLLPGRGMLALNVPRPRILPLSVPALRTRGSSGAAIYGQLEQFLSWAMELAGTDCEKWAEILDVGQQLPPELLLTALRRIATLVPALHDEQQVLWGALRSLLSIYEPAPQDAADHQDEPDATIQPHQNGTDALARWLYEQLTPSDFVAKHAWLFDARSSFPVRYRSPEEPSKLLAHAQRRCITELANRSDRWALLARLGNRVYLPWLSRLLAESTWAEELEQQLPQLESCGPQLAIWFLAWRLSRRDFAEVERWLRRFAAEQRPTDAALLAQLLTGGGAERDAQLWNILDSLGEQSCEAYWQKVEVHGLSSPAPVASTERAIRHLMDVERWEAAKTAAIVLKEPVSTALRLDLLRCARAALTPPNQWGSSYQVGWVEFWNRLNPQTPDELALARREEVVWLLALRDTHYRARFVPAWVTTDPRVFVDLVHTDTAEALLSCWNGWPYDSLPSEQGQEQLYSWARAVLAQLASSPQPRALSAPAMVLARPTGSDGLWPGEALRRLLEDEQRTGTRALHDALLSVRRDLPSRQMRKVTERIQSEQKLAAECEESAKQLSLTWPTAAKLCHKLSESYRETAGDWQERNDMRNELDGLKQEPSMLGPLFPLTKLEIKNFRGIAETTLPELHPRLNILYGRNASGKTTLLDALAIALGDLAPRLPGELTEKNGTWPAVKERDPHRIAGVPARQLGIAVSGQRVRGTPLSWQVAYSYARGAENQARESPDFQPYLDSLNERLRVGDPRVLLPVFAYYGVERVISEKAAQPATNSGVKRTRLDGLAGALESKKDFFGPATKWFADEYILQLQEREDRPGYERPGLREVSRTIESTVVTPEGQGVRKPRISKISRKLVFEFYGPGKPAEDLAIDELSDGFRTHLALVMDLARRMTECNPHPEGEREQPDFGCNSRAVVLIDEVDAHLHPSWQWTVLEGLLAAFPQAQFFVTTHSPIVLSSVSSTDAKIWLLEDGKVSQVGQLYGKTVADILEDYQDTAFRNGIVQDLIDRARKLLNEGKLDEADTGIKRLEALNSDLTELVGLRNRLLLARRGLSSPPEYGEKPPV